MADEEMITAEEAFNKSKDVVEGRAAIAAKIEKATAEGKFQVIGFPAPAVIDELRAKGYSVDDMTNFGKIQGYVISWKNGLVENIGTFEEGENTFNEPTKEIVLTGSVPAQAKVKATGKSVKLQSLKIEAAVVNTVANDNVAINNGELSGAYNKGSQGNAMITAQAAEKVEIKNTKFGATGYNAIEIGMNSRPKEVTIAHCDFSGACSNNAISVHDTADNAIINIEDCHFADVSNVLRISNKSGARLTINIKNCTVDKWETGEYAGCVICQDFTTGGAANLFGDGKVKINFFNLTGPNGVFKNKMAEDVCATGDENQLVYVYTNKVEAFDQAKYPVIKVL